MANEGSPELALANVLKRQKELQDTIKAATQTLKEAVQELEKINQFLSMVRSYSTESEADEKRVSDSIREEAVVPIKLRGGAHGQTQAVFEAFVLDILRDVGRPMKSPEFIEEFRKRGRPLGGNEVRTAWNRLWQARKAGVLTHDVDLGYWIAGEPLSDEAKARALEAGKRKPRGPGPSLQARTKGKPKGPPRALTPNQVAAIERLLLSGKSRREVCDLYGVAMNTLAGYVGNTDEFLARHPGVVIPKRPYVPRPRKPGAKPMGRRPNLSDEQAQKVVELKAQGKSAQEIADTMGVKRSTVYHTLNRMQKSQDT